MSNRLWEIATVASYHLQTQNNNHNDNNISLQQECTRRYEPGLLCTMVSMIVGTARKYEMANEIAGITLDIDNVMFPNGKTKFLDS